MNLRQATRYVLSCPAQYHWLSSDGLEQNGTGVTRDLAVSGAFVRGDRIPAVGTQIELSIALPNCEDTRTGMRLHGVGRVLRIDQQADANTGGFALSIRLDTSSP